MLAQSAIADTASRADRSRLFGYVYLEREPGLRRGPARRRPARRPIARELVQLRHAVLDGHDPPGRYVGRSDVVVPGDASGIGREGGLPRVVHQPGPGHHGPAAPSPLSRQLRPLSGHLRVLPRPSHLSGGRVPHGRQSCLRIRGLRRGPDRGGQRVARRCVVTPPPAPHDGAVQRPRHGRPHGPRRHPEVDRRPVVHVGCNRPGVGHLPSVVRLHALAGGGRSEQGRAMGNNQSMQVGAESLSGLAGGALAAIEVELPLLVFAGVAVAGGLTLARLTRRRPAGPQESTPATGLGSVAEGLT